MYYIKCNHCEALVEVKSQYMTFCPQCKHKMDNSFANWKLRNPQGDYKEYLGQVCVSGSAVEGVRSQRQIGRLIGRGRAAKRMVVALGVALGLTAVVIAGYVWISRATRGASITAIMDRTWKINYYEDLGVTLKFPHNMTVDGGDSSAYSPTAASAMIDSVAMVDTTQVILSTVSRRWSSPGVIGVTATRIDYEPDFGVDREVATRQILMSMLQENDLKGFEFFRNDYSIPNIEGRSLAGSYLLGVEAFEFRALMAQHNNTVWYFMVAYPRSTPEGGLVAERFFKGILIGE